MQLRITALKRIRLLLIVLCILVSCYGVAESDGRTLTMCVDNYSPLQILQPNGQVTGENVEPVKALVTKLGLSLTFTSDVPFARCMQWLKSGEVDIVSGLIATEERREFIHLYQYDDANNKTFFVRRDSGLEIAQFSDLKNLTIGVVRGTRHFEAFDNAPKGFFKPVYVGTLEVAFEMLALGRIDTLVCTGSFGREVLASNPRLNSFVKQSDYSVESGTITFIGLSKQSRFAHLHNDFARVAEDMYTSGEFSRIIEQFKTDNPSLYPETAH